MYIISDILNKLASYIHQGNLTQARNASIILSNMYAFDICEEVIQVCFKLLVALYIKTLSIDF